MMRPSALLLAIALAFSPLAALAEIRRDDSTARSRSVGAKRGA